MGFSHFNLAPTLFQAITTLGYAEPTPIQAAAIPEALKGRDVRACAQTGTGKTCAFMIPIVEKLTRHHTSMRPSALILVPTRELATQVQSVVHGLVAHTRLKTALILGGANFNSQVHQVKAGADIIVATPGRLKDHLKRNTISLRNIQMLVLDEADRMLDMGFLPDIKHIVSQTPHGRQTMLFSATFGNDIKSLTHQFLRDPAVVELSPSSTATSENVTQMVYPVPQGQKKAILQALLELNSMTSALIFCRTKNGANKLLKSLQELGKKVAVIHSNRSQGQRQQALQGFKDKRYQILVATDIAARGIDVKDISHVINFDVPRHAEDYVHRIGRTGRAQAVGEAFTLVSPDEEEFLRAIERFIKKTIPRTIIPDFPYQSQPRMFTKPQQQQHNRPHFNKPHQSSHHRPHQGKPHQPSRFQHPKSQHEHRPHQPSAHPQHPKPQHGERPHQPSHLQPQHSPKPHHPHQGPPKHGHGPNRHKKKFNWGRPQR